MALVCLLLGIGLRLARVVKFQSAPEADEAVVGLMARHIRVWQDLPVFYYGQAYLGALEAYGVALLGASGLALKLTPALFSIALVGVVYAWMEEAFGKVPARVCAAMMALPPAYVMDFGLRARGGFIEAQFLLATVIWLAHRLEKGGSDRTLGLLGWVCGLTVWTYQTFLAHLLVLGAMRWRTCGPPSRRRAGIWAFGFLVGCAPLVFYNLVHPLATVWEVGAKYAGVTGPAYHAQGLFEAAFRGGLKRLGEVLAAPSELAILYTSNPDVGEADGSLLGLTVIGLQAAAVLAGIGVAWRRRAYPSPGAIALAMVLATLATGFFRLRYMTPIVPFAAVLGGLGLSRLRPVAIAAALALVLGYNVRQTWADLEADTPAPYADLIAALDARGVRYGYSGYEIAYPVIFLTEERIILSPRAGPVFYDRIPAYTNRVRSQPRVCYIFEDGSQTDRRFRALLVGRSVPYERVLAGRFAVYDGLSPEVAHTLPLPVGIAPEH